VGKLGVRRRAAHPHVSQCHLPNQLRGSVDWMERFWGQEVRYRRGYLLEGDRLITIV
jgi:hypothetical protein